MLEAERLKELGEAGILVGPGESEEAFVKRLDILQEVEREPSKLLEKRSFSPWEGNFEEILAAHPTWLPFTYSNRGLLPWQGAALWVFGNKVPLVQLRKGFQKGKFFSYSKEEVLLHETVHAIRAPFNEPKYEEILAYTHSKSKWRKFFGPLFRKPSQTIFFIFLIFISLAIQSTSLLFVDPSFFPYLQFLSLIPFADLALRSAILIRDRRLLSKALQKLSKIFPTHAHPFAIALRLTDVEIQKFAIEPIEDLLSYIEGKIPDSLRWRQILAQFH